MALAEVFQPGFDFFDHGWQYPDHKPHGLSTPHTRMKIDRTQQIRICNKVRRAILVAVMLSVVPWALSGDPSVPVPSKPSLILAQVEPAPDAHYALKQLAEDVPVLSVRSIRERRVQSSGITVPLQQRRADRRSGGGSCI